MILSGSFDVKVNRQQTNNKCQFKVEIRQKYLLDAFIRSVVIIIWVEVVFLSDSYDVKVAVCRCGGV